MKTYIKTVAAYSHTNDADDVDTLDFNFNEARIEEESFKYNTFSVSTFINHKFNAKNVVRAGMTLQNKAYKLKHPMPKTKKLGNMIVHSRPKRPIILE